MRRRAAFLFIFSLMSTALCATVFADGAPAPVFVVIVNAANPAATLDQTFVADAFLKKITHWPNDEVVRPADLASGSPIRRRFTEDILKRSVEAVKGYWQQRIFSGRDVPPPEFDTDDEVIRYVRKYPGAIGYVSASATPSGSKVVIVR